MPHKLTLSMDEDLIHFAHELAQEKNDSISSLVAAYFRGLQKQRLNTAELHPSVRKMLGSYEGRGLPKDKTEMLERHLQKHLK
jgi:hypothetical protein